MQIEKVIIELLSVTGDPARVLRDEPMKRHTSFKIGGPADVMVLAESAQEIADTLLVCRELGVPVAVIGNGTNLLVRDKGIRGVVLKIGKGFSRVDFDKTRVRAQAGVPLSTLANRTLAKGLAGLEFAGGIPGTLGGAVVMNAGAYGGEIADCLTRVWFTDRNGNTGSKAVEKGDLGYRRSVFADDGAIVLEAEFILREDAGGEALLRARVINAKRSAKQPLNVPSAGSTFKRPAKGYASRLIDAAGLKGLTIGGAQVSELHAGFIVNTGGATAADVLELADAVRARVKGESGVDLDLEIKIIGEQ